MVLSNPFESPEASNSNGRSHRDGPALPFDRLAAHVADFILLMPLMALAMAPFRRTLMEAKLLNDVWGGDWALINGAISALLVGVLWETVMISLWSTTPGRAIFGLRIVDVWSGEKPRPAHAFLRAIAWWLSWLALGAPFFGVYSNLKRRPIHDRIADTQVVSKNAKRHAKVPMVSELAFGAVFTSFSLFFAVVFSTGQIFLLREHSRVADERSKPQLCELVSSSIQDWESREVRPTRISVALSLSSAGLVDSNCLEQEADYALWNDHGRVFGYFAKGLIRFGHDNEEAESYFSKVCDLEPDSESCRLIGYFREQMSPDNESERRDSGESVETLEKLAKSLPRMARASPEWLRLIVLRELLTRQGDPELILQMTQEPAKHALVGAKLVEYRARALWKLGRKEDAKATIWTAADALPRQQRVSITSWLCNRELYESNCSTDSQRACEMMERSADSASGDWAMPSYLVASLRQSECRANAKSSTNLSGVLARLAKHVDDASGRRLIESVKHLRLGEREKGIQELRELASSEDSADDIFVTEANIRLIEEVARAPIGDKRAEKELTALKERWFASRNAKRFTDWGRALFAVLNARELWGPAAEVGIMLGADVEHDHSLQKRIAIAAWRAGKQKLAAEMVEAVERSRVPASVETRESGDEVFEAIRRSGRRR